MKHSYLTIAAIFALLFSGCQQTRTIVAELKIGMPSETWLTQLETLQGKDITSHFTYMSRDMEEHVMEGIVWELPNHESWIAISRGNDESITRLIYCDIDDFRNSRSKTEIAEAEIYCTSVVYYSDGTVSLAVKRD